MNFRLGPSSRREHPNWLPTAFAPIFFGVAGVGLFSFIQGLPLIFTVGPLLFALFVVLPLPRYIGAFLTVGSLLALLFIEETHNFPLWVNVLFSVTIGVLSALLRSTLLRNEWKFAALTLWQAIDESKA